MNTTHFEHIIVSAQAEPPIAQQPLRGVRQDNPTPPRERIASPQPGAGKTAMRSQPMSSSTPRSQNTPKRRTTQLIVWVKPHVKAEIQRIAEREGLSLSATGSALLEQALQQNLHTQHKALLDPIIEKAIGKHMRAYSTRIALLLVRVAFASEQTRSLATNILGRQAGVSQPVLEEILNGSSNSAKRNITRVTPQLADLIKEVEGWLKEGESTHA